MNIESRLARLEDQNGHRQHCPACAPGPSDIVLTFGADDPDSETPPGDDPANLPLLRTCPECGQGSRIFGTC